MIVDGDITIITTRGMSTNRWQARETVSGLTSDT